MLPLQIRVDQGALAMNGYSVVPKAPALVESHYHIGFLPHCRDAVGVFYGLSRLGCLFCDERIDL